MKLSAEDIEAAVDADGAWNVLLALEIVLDEKAAHIATNWADKAYAARYTRMALRCGRLAREMEKLDI